MKISIYIVWLIIAVIIQICLFASSTHLVYDSELGLKEIGLTPFLLGLFLNGVMILIFWTTEEKKIKKEND